VRGAAATALGLLADRRAVAGLLACLHPEQEAAPAVRGAAATALGAMGDRCAVASLLACLQREREPDAAVRGAAATALGLIGDAAAVSGLLPLLQPSRELDAATRGAVANALGMLGDPRSVPALLDVLRDRDDWVRSATVKALARIGGPAARTGVVRLLRDPNPKVRGVALSGCLTMPTPDLFEPLRERFDTDEDAINRTNAIKGLSLLGDARAAPYCLRGLRDADAGVRGESARGLVRLVPTLPAGEAEQAARRLTQYWLQCRDGDTANAIYYALKELPPALAHAAVTAMRGSEHERRLPGWKHRRWEQLAEEIALALRCESEAAALRRQDAVQGVPP